ncbi:MAG: VOC family protein [Stutzerimonas stutzeri]|nr:MAG: VOC family protein [Stutzerimonas stutzeri]
MFQENGALALEFYKVVLPDVVVESVDYYAEGELLPSGTLKVANLSFAGQSIRLFNSPAVHKFNFTPSISIFVECETEDELRQLAAALQEGGSEMMAVGDYGFSKLYGWVTDGFGVSWQLNLA